MPPRGFALDEIVKTDPQHSRDELEEADAAALAFVAEVGGEWFRPLSGRSSAAIIFLAECRREAFVALAARDFAGERLARL